MRRYLIASALAVAGFVALAYGVMVGTEWGIRAFLRSGNKGVRRVTFAPLTLGATIEDFTTRSDRAELSLPEASADFTFESFYSKPQLSSLTLQGPTIVYRVQEDGVETTVKNGEDSAQVPDVQIETLRIQDGRVKVVQGSTTLFDLKNVGGTVQPFSLTADRMNVRLNAELTSPDHSGSLTLFATMKPSERSVSGELVWANGAAQHSFSDTTSVVLDGAVLQSGFRLSKKGLHLIEPAVHADSATIGAKNYHYQTAATINADSIAITPRPSPTVGASGLAIRADTGSITVGGSAIAVDRSGCRAETLHVPFVNTTLSCQVELSKPGARVAFNGRLSDSDAPFHLRMNTKSLNDFSPYLKALGAPFELKTGRGETQVAGTIKRSGELDGEFYLRLKKAVLESTGEDFLGLSTTLYQRYLQEREGTVVIPVGVDGTITSPVLDFTSIRTRVTAHAGLETGLVAAVGLPAFFADEALRRLTDKSILGEVRRGVTGIVRNEPKPPGPPPGLKRPDYSLDEVDLRRPIQQIKKKHFPVP